MSHILSPFCCDTPFLYSEDLCNCSNGGEGILDPDECDQITGQCSCLMGYIGLQCEDCEEGYFSNGTSGCLPCACDSFGAVNHLCDRSGWFLCFLFGWRIKSQIGCVLCQNLVTDMHYYRLAGVFILCWYVWLNYWMINISITFYCCRLPCQNICISKVATMGKDIKKKLIFIRDSHSVSNYVLSDSSALLGK